MPNWHQINQKLKDTGSTYDLIRREYLNNLYKYTGRNTIIYYSGWLQQPIGFESSVNDNDKNGFMTVINGLDRSKGLDLVIHTPGGAAAATESIVDYLKVMFSNDIRVIVPQLAMSAGTMIACSAKEIVMGKQSSLGPIDPQFKGIPAHGIVEEFDTAFNEMKKDPHKANVWQPILAKYSPTLVGEAKKAIQWSESMVKGWLIDNMLKDEPKKDEIAKTIIEELGDHSISLSHDRHLSLKKCKEIGLKIVELEGNDGLQDAVLSVHHACMHTFTATAAIKIIENHEGIAFINSKLPTILPR